MKLSGKVKKIFDIETFASGFQKQEIVLTTDDQYPQDILIQFLQNNIDLLQHVQENDDIEVSINIGGREWTSPTGEVRYFNSITGWRIVTNQQKANKPTPKMQEYQTTQSDEDDGLPF